MKQPRPRGTLIDAARFAQWIERFAGYRAHVSQVRIDQWLGQFQEDHRDLAARVLDAVEFYREDHLTPRESRRGELMMRPRLSTEGTVTRNS